MSTFSGFPAGTATFLQGIGENNEKTWFDAHRDAYEACYVAPAKAFVAAIGPRLREISPDVSFEPKVNGSIFRINRDVRFSKDKRPYRNHIDLWFWHGAHRGSASPGFFFRMYSDRLILGAGMHQLEKPQLEVVPPRRGRGAFRREAGGSRRGGSEGRPVQDRRWDPQSLSRAVSTRPTRAPAFSCTREFGRSSKPSRGRPQARPALSTSARSIFAQCGRYRAGCSTRSPGRSVTRLGKGGSARAHFVSMLHTLSCRYFRLSFGWCVPIGALAGLIGLGGGEFRLPV